MSVCTSYGQQGSETGALLYERRWRGDASKRGIIYCHGHGGFSWNVIAFPDPLLTALVQAGFPVIVPELGGTATWGNDTAQTAMTNAFSQLKSALGAKNAAPLIVCYSMGALPAFLWAKTNPVAAIVGEAPAVDLADIHDNNRGSYATDIEAAYGGSTGYSAAIGTHNPATATSSFTGIPSRLYYSTGSDGSGDGIITSAAVSAFQAAVGSNCSKVSVGNVVHTAVPTSLSVSDALSFLQAHA